MKTQIKTALIALMLAIGVNLSAKESEIDVNISVENKKAVVLFMNNLHGNTSIQLKDASGNILFSDKTHEEFFGKVFNMERIEPGQMYLEIDSRDRVEQLLVEVTETSARIVNKEVLAVKPLVQVHKDLAKVITGGSGKDVEISLFSAYGEIHYKEVFSDEEITSKKFDLSRLAPGQYKFRFKIGGKYFYHGFSLK